MIKCYTDIRFTKGVDDMYRSAIEKLKKWKDSYFRKPLIIEGARQVGKTWLTSLGWMRLTGECSAVSYYLCRILARYRSA